MPRTSSRPPDSSIAEGGRPALRPLVSFAVLAVLAGWILLTVPILTGLPQEPFVLAATFLAMLLPALVLTAREGGRDAVLRLLRDAVRLPVAWWWIPLAMLGIPVAVWIAGAALGSARPVTASLVLGFVVSLLSSALIINIWEELALTGFFQRRAMARWGVIGGSLVTALVFAGIHLPLGLAGGDPVLGVTTLLLAALGIRLLIAGVDRWSGRSILTVGLLHGSFNAASGLLVPGADWIRITVAVLLGLLVAVLLSTRGTAAR